MLTLKHTSDKSTYINGGKCKLLHYCRSLSQKLNCMVLHSTNSCTHLKKKQIIAQDNFQINYSRHTQPHWTTESRYTGLDVICQNLYRNRDTRSIHKVASRSCGFRCSLVFTTSYDNVESFSYPYIL